MDATIALSNLGIVEPQTDLVLFTTSSMCLVKFISLLIINPKSFTNSFFDIAVEDGFIYVVRLWSD